MKKGWEVDDYVNYVKVQMGGSIVNLACEQDLPFIVEKIAFEYLKANNMLSIIYFLDKNFRDKGYLSEALHIAEKEMFRRGFINLLLKIDRNNIPSQRVAKLNNYVLKDSADDILSFIKSSKSNN